MKTCHGPNWTREVHAPTSWICPFCGDAAAVFEKPDDLALHLEGLHADILMEAQVPAVVRQSMLHYSRAPDICPLCCFSVSRQRGQKQAREPLTLGSKVESSDDTAAHVAPELTPHPCSSQNHRSRRHPKHGLKPVPCLLFHTIEPRRPRPGGSWRRCTRRRIGLMCYVR
jgi:hypothetical protein